MPREPRPRLFLLDKCNNIFTIVEPSETLQKGFDRLVKLVEKQGKMDLCVGEIHCCFFQQTPVRLKLISKKPGQVGCKWKIRFGE